MKGPVIILLVFYAQWLFAQAPAFKIISAKFAVNKIELDGRLTEPEWKNAEIGTDFVQRAPNPGEPLANKSEVCVLYNDEAIFIGAKLFARAKETSRQFTQRDQLNNSDWFGLILCPYQDGTNGVSFITTPEGGQFDSKYSAIGEDAGWDAVWEVETHTTEEYWTVEMKIPYSAIRFPDTPVQEWGVNFVRNIFQRQETGFWNEVDRTVNGFLTQVGKLEGIKDIKPPVRLSATPFVSGYLEHFNDHDDVSPQTTNGRSFNAGMDIKYGLSDAFTLDMTLIPDFGEAQSDNEILNLSAFEVQFDENRQFFTEGTELFNKGDIFYSRRVGGSPLKYADDFVEEGDELISSDGEVQLYNATKVSGRTAKGTGLGFFNAVTGRSSALIKKQDGKVKEVQTSPITNYSVAVFDQNLKNNSYVSLVNTNVWRNGDDYDANVTAAVFDIKNKKQSYGIYGNYKLSQLFFNDNTKYQSFIDDELYLTGKQKNKLNVDETKTTLLGFSSRIGARKTSGKFNWALSWDLESHTYEINDLGFLGANNQNEISLELNYSELTPFGSFTSMGVGAWLGYSRLYNPSVSTETGVNLWWWCQTKSFWSINVWSYGQPIEYDYFEPRTPGRRFQKAPFLNFGFNISTDQRKPLTMWINARNGGAVKLYDFNFWGLGYGFNYRVNDHWTFNFSSDYANTDGRRGYVNTMDNDDIIFGGRLVKEFENSIRTEYNFTKNISLNFRLRHYWSVAKYNQFFKLLEEGNFADYDYEENAERI